MNLYYSRSKLRLVLQTSKLLLAVWVISVSGCSSGSADAQSIAQQKQEIESLRAENQDLSQLRKANEEVRRLKVENRDLAKLRGQAQELKRLREENGRLRAQLAKLQGSGNLAPPTN